MLILILFHASGYRFIAKVGDYYFEDDTYGSDLNGRTPLGVIFHVNEDGTSGKIVSLDEGSGRWGVSSYDEDANGVAGIRDKNDGATATKNLIAARKEGANFATDYYAFNWIYATKNGNNLNGRWYLPAMNKLSAFYTAWNLNRDAFNSKLTAAEDTAISAAAGRPPRAMATLRGPSTSTMLSRPSAVRTTPIGSCCVRFLTTNDKTSAVKFI